MFMQNHLRLVWIRASPSLCTVASRLATRQKCSHHRWACRNDRFIHSRSINHTDPFRWRATQRYAFFHSRSAHGERLIIFLPWSYQSTLSKSDSLKRQSTQEGKMIHSFRTTWSWDEFRVCIDLKWFDRRAKKNRADDASPLGVAEAEKILLCSAASDIDRSFANKCNQLVFFSVSIEQNVSTANRLSAAS